MCRTLLRAAWSIGLLVVALGCTTEHTLKVHVTGTSGVRFTGYCVVHAGGSESRRPLDQEVPFEVELLGNDVSCMAQKSGLDGTEPVEILVDDRPVTLDWTRDRYGHVSAATP